MSPFYTVFASATQSNQLPLHFKCEQRQPFAAFIRTTGRNFAQPEQLPCGKTVGGLSAATRCDTLDLIRECAISPPHISPQYRPEGIRYQPQRIMAPPAVFNSDAKARAGASVATQLFTRSNESVRRRRPQTAAGFSGDD